MASMMSPGGAVVAEVVVGDGLDGVAGDVHAHSGEVDAEEVQLVAGARQRHQQRPQVQEARAVRSS